VERVEGCCLRGEEEEGGGRLQQIGERERGSARVGEERGGAHPPDRNQWPKLALPFELLTPAEKMPKDLLFPEECLLKLQTRMPQNKKEKRKRSLTSFQKIGVSHSTPLKKNSSSNSPTPSKASKVPHIEPPFKTWVHY
jgi:hypothetical protein